MYYVLIGIILYFTVYKPKYLARCILYMCGWKGIPQRLRDVFDHPKLVLIYPHTSYWDTVYLVLHRLAYPKLLKNLTFLIGPYFLKIPILGCFLRSVGGIAATCVHTKNGGRTQEIIDLLNRREEFQLMISPKGTTRKSEWRSGYYHITEGTHAVITVVGFDYRQRRIMIYDPQNIDMPLLPQELLEKWLQDRMRELPQLNPQNVEY